MSDPPKSIPEIPQKQSTSCLPESIGGGNVPILWSNQGEPAWTAPKSSLIFSQKHEFGISLCHGAKSFSLISLADRQNQQCHETRILSAKMPRFARISGSKRKKIDPESGCSQGLFREI